MGHYHEITDYELVCFDFRYAAIYQEIWRALNSLQLDRMAT